ncbi:MAG: DUF192 domain-containing protein [Candidatus Paceibacterota bacterium]
MHSLRRILIDIIVLFTIVVTLMYVYQTYGERISTYLFGEQREGIIIDDVSILVSYADEPKERTQRSFRYCFVRRARGNCSFDELDYHGIWMKDMLFPIDIIWIDNDLTVIHIEENVTPETYPAVFRPTEPARFVLEVNAHFVDQFQIKVGDPVTIPAADLPTDLREELQN